MSAVELLFAGLLAVLAWSVFWTIEHHRELRDLRRRIMVTEARTESHRIVMLRYLGGDK